MPRPAQISRTAVLTASLELADEQGLAALSMRSVASRLRVSPMALYRYVGDKQGLLDGIVEQLLVELPLPEPSRPWRQRLDMLGESLRQTARRHPDVFPLLLQRPTVTPGAVRVRDLVYDALREAGLAEAAIPRLERILSTVVLGFATSEATSRFDSVSKEELDADFTQISAHVLDNLSILEPRSSTSGSTTR